MAAVVAPMGSGFEPAPADLGQFQELSEKELQQTVLTCNKDGMNFLRSGQFKQAFEQLKYAEALLTAKETEEEPTNLMAVTCNNLGCYYKKANKLHAALSYLRKALKIEVSLQTDDVTVAGTHLNICAILSKLDKHEKALQHAQCALELITNRVTSSGDAASQDEFSVLSIAYHNVAVERDFLHQFDEAAAAYQQGHEVAKKWLGEQHPLTQTLAKNSDLALQKSKKTVPRERLHPTVSSPAAPIASAAQRRKGAPVPEAAAGSSCSAVSSLPEIPAARFQSQEQVMETDSWPVSGLRTSFYGEEMEVPERTVPSVPSSTPLPDLRGKYHAPLQESVMESDPWSVRPSFYGGAGHMEGHASFMPQLMPLQQQMPSWGTQDSGLDACGPPLVLTSQKAPLPRAVRPPRAQRLAAAAAAAAAAPEFVLDAKAKAEGSQQVGSAPKPETLTFRERRERARAAAAGTRNQAVDQKPLQPQLLRKTAASKIQRFYRARRRQLREAREKEVRENASATKLQARWRAYWVRKTFRSKAAVIIQKWARGFLVRLVIKRHNAAVVIQRHALGMMVRRNMAFAHAAATCIQKRARGILDRQRAKAKRDCFVRAAIVLQGGARMLVAKKVVAEQRQVQEAAEVKDWAVLTIQSTWWGIKARRRVAVLRMQYQGVLRRIRAATVIQALARAVLARRRVESIRQKKLQDLYKAATTIRKYWLRYNLRRRYQQLKEEYREHEGSVVTLQRYMRGFLVRLRLWRQAIQQEEELWAATEIQRCWRGYMGRLRWELEYESIWSRETAARRIQRFVRGWLARTKVQRMRKRAARAEFEQARRRFKAAQKIQARVRGVQARARVHVLRHRKDAAVVKIQGVWRGYNLRKNLWEQAAVERVIRLQAVARGFLVRNRRYHQIMSAETGEVSWAEGRLRKMVKGDIPPEALEVTLEMYMQGLQQNVF